MFVFVKQHPTCFFAPHKFSFKQLFLITSNSWTNGFLKVNDKGRFFYGNPIRIQSTENKKPSRSIEPGYLVGGFNPFEKQLVKMEIISPSRGENKKYLKPHHLVISHVNFLDFIAASPRKKNESCDLSSCSLWQIHSANPTNPSNDVVIGWVNTYYIDLHIHKKKELERISVIERYSTNKCYSFLLYQGTW